MAQPTIVKSAQITALVSFILGTILFAGSFSDISENLIEIGITYVIIAGIINCCVLLVLLISCIGEKEHLKLVLLTAGMMLLNIPIALFYMWVVIMNLS